DRVSESSTPVAPVPPTKRTGFAAALDRYFHVTARGSNFAREIRGGLATFFAMAYIVVVNPLIIGTAPDINGDTLGLERVAAVTALVAAVSSILMGVISRYPFAIASGMGLNAIVAYVLAPMMTWADVMGLVVIEGVIMLLLVFSGFRKAVFNAVPASLKSAIGVGVGLFLALIGFVHAGFVRPGDGTPVQLGVGGSLNGWPILVFVLGFVVTIVLMVRQVKGAVLIGIVFATVLGIVVELFAKVGPRVDEAGQVNDLGWALNVPTVPTSADDLVSLPDLSLVGQFNLLADWRGVGIATMLMLVLTLLLADFFDTMGTMVGVAGQAGLTDKDGNVPNSQEVLVADALGTVVGGAASASVATTYAESAAGVGEGART